MKKRFYLIAILAIVGTISLYFLATSPYAPLKKDTQQSQQDRTEKGNPGKSDPNTHASTKATSQSLTWEEWLNKQVDIQLEELLRLAAAADPEIVTELENDIVNVEKSMRNSLQKMMVELKKESDTPPSLRVIPVEDMPRPDDEPIKRHEGPQTAEAITETFKGMNQNSTPELDGLYPQEEWIQMLLDRGIVINDYADYSGYMTARGHLPWLEANPDVWDWAVPAWRLPPTEDVQTLDWEVIKKAYIDQEIYQYETLRDARATDPTIGAGVFVGKNSDIFLPVREKTVYVNIERYENGSIGYGTLGKSLTEEQKFNLFYRGIEPEGYEVTYLDSEYQPLSEPFQPISPEEVLDPEEYQKYLQQKKQKQEPTQQTPTFDGEGWKVPNDPFESENKRIAEKFQEEQQNEFEKVWQEKMKEWATLTDAEFENVLKEMFAPRTPTENDRREIFIQKPITRKRFEEALEMIERHGPKRGFEEIYRRDPEMAKRIEQEFREKPRAYPNRENRNNLLRKERNPR